MTGRVRLAMSRKGIGRERLAADIGAKNESIVQQYETGQDMSWATSESTLRKLEAALTPETDREILGPGVRVLGSSSNFQPDTYLYQNCACQARQEPWMEWCSIFLASAKALAEREASYGEQRFDPQNPECAAFVASAARLRAAAFGDLGFAKRAGGSERIATAAALCSPLQMLESEPAEPFNLNGLRPCNCTS